MSRFGVAMPVFELAQGVKDEVVLLPYGRNETVDGGNKFNFTQADAQGVVEFFKSRGIDFQFDWEHQSIAHLKGFEHFKAPNGKAPAAGWAKELAAGETGLVAKSIRWTPEAVDAIQTGKYRYQSPVLVLDKETGSVKAIQCAGLTNEPRLKNIPALAAKCDLAEILLFQERSSEMSTLLVALAGALALGATATDQDVLNAVNQLKGKATAGESAAGQVTAFKSQAETSATKVTELEGKLAKATSDLTAATAIVTTKDSEIAAFKTQIDNAQKALADAVLAYAEETGRIAPAGKTAFKAQVDKDPAGMLAAFKSMTAGSAVPVGKITDPAKKVGEPAAPDDHLVACKATAGFDPERLKVHEAALSYQAANKGTSYVDAVTAVTKK